MATLKDVERIVIKVGTSTLAHDTGKANLSSQGAAGEIRREYEKKDWVYIG